MLSRALKHIKIFALLAVYLFPFPLIGGELIGVLPLTNQRLKADSDWIGFYIQARMEALLRRNSDWRFHTLRTLQSWQFGSDRSQPVTSHSTVLIAGSFQQVGDFAYIQLQAKRYRPQSGPGKTFEVTFALVKLDEVLTEMAHRVGNWIQSGFTVREGVDFPSFGDPEVETFFRMQHQLFQPGAFPETRLVLRLLDAFSSERPVAYSVGLAEGMLILSLRLTETERDDIIRKTETLLRQAIEKNRSDPFVLGLLAETFLIGGKPMAWVEKTAMEAVEQDRELALGHVLILLSADLDEPALADRLEQLNAANPWFWEVVQHERVSFQKNLLNEAFRAYLDR
jgi:hypothetical protein